MGESLRFGNEEEDDAWDTSEDNPDYGSGTEKRGVVELENGFSQNYALPGEGVITHSDITEASHQLHCHENMPVLTCPVISDPLQAKLR